MSDRTSFDNQIFTWENAIDEGPLTMQFVNVELTAPVGNYPVGTKFPFAFIIGEGSLLVLIDDQEQQHAFDLKLTVGEEVQMPEHDHGDSCDCGHDH